MSSTRDRRRRVRGKALHARDQAALTLTLRTLTPLRRDTHVHYADGVAERRIDRTAWAKEVQRLIAEEAGGNRAEFARLIKRGYKTVGRWLDEEVDVSEESVRAVASTLHINAFDLLVRIGYYRSTDMPTPLPAAPSPGNVDEAARMIEESDFAPRIKARMKQRLDELRARRAAAEVEEVKWWLDQAKEA